MSVKIVHYTHKDNLPKILESGMIYDQLLRNKTKIRVGEGDLTRRCCYPTNSFKTKPKTCTEGCGLYFRVVKPGQKIIKPFANNVALVFDEHILNRYKWHMNFCENNGLWIDDGIAHLGSEGVCQNSSDKLSDVLTTDFDQLDGEIIIYKSVDLKNLESIFDRNMNSIPFTRNRSKSKSKTRSWKKSRSSDKSRRRKTL